jgi:hypothetical protein
MHHFDLASDPPEGALLAHQSLQDVCPLLKGTLPDSFLATDLELGTDD